MVDSPFSPSAIEEQVRALHDFFGRWIRGEVPDDPDYIDRFRYERVHPRFTLIMPGGGHIDPNGLGEVLRDSHGANPRFAVHARALQLRHSAGTMAVVTYEELQRNALTTPTPNTGRLCTGVLLAEDDGVLRWLHLHQTWLPPDSLTEEDFEF